MKNTCFLLALLLIALNVFAQEITFTTHIVDNNFDGPAGIFVADINNDGNEDIISAALDAGTIAWWENQPGDSITWQKQIVDDNFIGAIYVSAYDVDSDSLTDILGAAYDGKEIAWWHNDGGNPIQWTKQIIESNFTDAHEIMAYDVDKDNDMDILGVSAGLNTIAWFENDGNYPVQWTKHIVDSSFAGARSVDAGDLDGDGDVDLAGAALSDNEVAWWRNDGGSPIEWTKFTINSTFTYSHKVHIADI
ncbi:MAG: VCBS repeat-containing protein, partial [Bacteroidales bacterium]|nr:VCBS repeat-containing protein [Bacteroidales bacterium]